MTFIETRRRRRSSKSLTTVSIATSFALLVTASTLCLTLLGYGHDLAYLDAIGFRPEQLQRTPLDFLLRSWQPVVHLLTQVNKLNELEFHRLFWTGIWWKTWWLLLSLPLFTAFAASYVNYKPRCSVHMQRVLRRLNRLDRLLGYLQTQCKKVTTQLSTWWANPIRRLGYAGWLAWPVGLGSIFFFFSITYFIVGFGTLVVASVPLIGMPSGATTARQEVIHPVGCLGQLLQKPDDAERQARCVLIKREGQEIARGYLVDYGAGRVFLYLPCTKQAISLSLERTSVEQVRSLEFANPGKDCRVQ